MRTPGGGDRAGDVDALAARVDPVAGGAQHLAAVQRGDLVGPVEGGVGGDGEDHARTTSVPAASIAAASSGRAPVGDEQVDVGEGRRSGRSAPGRLGGVGEQHHAAGGGDRGALDGGLGEVGGGQAVLGGEAVGRRGRGRRRGSRRTPAAPRRRRRRGYGAGRGRRPGGGRCRGGRRAGRRSGRRVGDDGERGLQRDRGGEAGDGRAGVEDDRCRRSGSSARAASAMRSFSSAAVASRSVRSGSKSRRPAGMAPPCTRRTQAGPVEGLEVAADGLGGDLELLGERQHVDPAAVAGEAEDLLLALRCVHVGSRPFHARTCGFARRLRPDFRKVNRFGRSDERTSGHAERGHGRRPGAGHARVRAASAGRTRPQDTTGALLGGRSARSAPLGSALALLASGPACAAARTSPRRSRPGRPPPTTARAGRPRRTAGRPAGAGRRRSAPKKTTEIRPRPSALPIWPVGVDQARTPSRRARAAPRTAPRRSAGPRSGPCRRP